MLRADHVGYELMDDYDEVTRTTQIMLRLNIQYMNVPLTTYKAPTSFRSFTLNRDKWQEVYLGLALWNTITCHFII